MKKLYLFVKMTLALPAFVLTLNAQSQNIVTGKVTSMDDASGLPGVNIMIKGTSTGTTSDIGGNYSLEVPAEAILVFSSVGYVSEEIAVGNQSIIDMVMTPDITALEEIVVIGYGSQTKRSVTGAIASLDSKALEQQPLTTLEEGFQGKLSGVQVLPSTGQPGAGSSIRIRGVTSLSGSSEPLYVIDGVPQFNGDVREANGFSNLDPNEIASVEVLKDAASTAIYGSRAANGVVMITTKSGKSGAPSFKYSGNVGIQQVRNKIPLMSGSEYYDYNMAYWDNSIADGTQTQAAKDQAIQEFNDIGIANVDWQDEFFETAIRQNHNLTVSGGTDRSKYFVSAGYTNHEGIIKGTDFQRVALRANLDNKINDRVNLTTRLAISRTSQNRFIGTDGTNNTADAKTGLGAIFNMEPTIPPYNSNGDISDAQPYTNSGVNNVNPLAYEDAVDQRIAYRFQGILEGRVKIIEGLTNTTRLGATYDRSKTDQFIPLVAGVNGQQVQLYTRDNLNLLAENFFSYKKQITPDFGLDVVAGISYQQDERELLGIEGKGLPDDVLKHYALQALSTMAPPETFYIDQSLNSLFLRANFNIKERYLINASVRRDGASQFAAGNKFATFPAASVAWRVSEEGFLSDSRVISNMKIRASLGQSGNQAIIPYQSLTIGTNVNTPTGSGIGLNTGLAPNLPNTDLTWETTTQVNLGLDFGFIDEKYRFSFDVYEKNTADLLAYVSLPPSAGFSQIIDNLGDIRNRGIEISAAMDIPVNDDLMFVVDANFTKNENKVMKTNNGEDIISGGSNDNTWSTTIVREGESLSSFYLIKFLGMDNEGIAMHEDINEDGIIDGADRQIVGKSLPDFMYGINISGFYKRFSLYMNFAGAAGLSVHNTYLSAMVSPGPGQNKRKDLTAFYPRPSDNAATAHRNSSRFLEDASFFRLRNIKLNYSIPTKSDAGSSMFDVYLSAQNLLTITDYTGYDPEVNSYSGSGFVSTQGVDNRAYPSVKTFTLGLNITF